MGFPMLDTYAKSIESVPKELVAELRQKAVERCEKSPDLYYSEDVERLKRDDWSVR
ncbi:unnamed protein product, partial [Oppiella nova]